jgi:two-component system sensor histidine kinase DesK
MSSSMSWLTTVIRITIAPVLIGALVLLLRSPRGASDLAAGLGLLLLAAVHIVYWLDPWQRQPRQAVSALAAMLVINFALLNLLGLTEPLLWLYPALIAGAGLRTPFAVLGIGLTALAAAAPLAFEAGFIHPSQPLRATETLGPSHSILLSIVLAGLGMYAVRQLIAANSDLHSTRAQLADLAVTADRERLARELHDLLARTLSLIAVKAELASRLSARGDPGASAELSDVQRLARQAVRDVREAVSGSLSPSLEAELAAARPGCRSRV